MTYASSFVRLFPFLVMTCLLVSPSSAEAVFPAASGVGLEPAPGMTVATDILGFRKGPALVAIIEMDKGAYADLEAKKSALENQLGASASQAVTVGGVAGFLVRGHHESNGTVFRKWIEVLDGRDETVMVTVAVPDLLGDPSNDEVEALLRTVVFRAKPAMPARIAALPFTVGDFAGFRPTGTLLGRSLSLTEGSKDADREVTQPHVFVSAQPQQLERGMTPELFAQLLLQGTKGCGTAGEGKKITGKDDTVWIAVEGTGEEHDVALTCKQYTRFVGPMLIVVNGRFRIGDERKYEARLQTLALSVDIKH